jgi:hypothetical protein
MHYTYAFSCYDLTHHLPRPSVHPCVHSNNIKKNSKSAQPQTDTHTTSTKIRQTKNVHRQPSATARWPAGRWGPLWKTRGGGSETRTRRGPGLVTSAAPIRPMPARYIKKLGSGLLTPIPTRALRLLRFTVPPPPRHPQPSLMASAAASAVSFARPVQVPLPFLSHYPS